MGLISEQLLFALMRADPTTQPPDATLNTQLNARGFFRFVDSGGYEYANRNTVSSPTGDGQTHLVLFQHEPIVYVKLNLDMQPVESISWLTAADVLAFLDGPDYTGNGIQIQVSCDAVLI